jgi:2,3-bisphosphoglycerate-independent phosphoglycerate mutase
MGNSEVGHNTLGSGRIFDQGAKQVDKAIESGRIWRGDWELLLDQVTSHQSTLHLIGLLSDGNVHSSISHLFTIIDRALHEGITHLRVHILLDGRDVSDFSSLTYVEQLEEKLQTANTTHGVDYKIASGGGRMSTTMDRYGADWSVVERGWQAHVLGVAKPATSTKAAITEARSATPGISDQDLPGFTIVGDDGEPVGPILDGDGVLVFNFRGDRAMEITRALTEDETFTCFDRVRVPKIFFAALVLYDADLKIPQHYLVTPEMVPGTASEYLAASKVHQFAVAETQKFGHITYFWNGNRAGKFDEALETYVEIASDKVPFQQIPQMKSSETAREIINATNSNRYEFIRANFAAGDMVGHTADLEATYCAIVAIDHALGEIASAVTKAKGCLVITADHGNAEDMAQRDTNGVPLTYADGRVAMKTSHSLNPVEFLLIDTVGRPFDFRNDLPDAGLANVASTLIELLGFIAPAEYEPSLLRWS